MSANRKDIKLIRSSISEVLPEHFTTDYPNLVSFLDAYYQAMSGTDAYAFNTKIQNVYGNRDIIGNDIDVLKELMFEMAAGVDITTLLSDPRLKTLRLANFYRSKGTLYGYKEFFRWLFNEDVEVEYGKNSMFIVGESQIGPQSLKYIKNAELYQTFSILLKVGAPVSQWRDFYKTFCHPAGFYFQGQVVIESVYSSLLNGMPLVILDSDAGTLTVEAETGVISASSYTNITGLYADDNDLDNEIERLNLNKTIQAYSDITIEHLDSAYDSIEELLDMNSPTLDMMYDGVNKSPKFSSTYETLDQDKFDLTQPTMNQPFVADSDLMDTVMDNTFYTIDNGRITMDRTL